jgi:AcrR family transcriptional regulator
MKVVARRGFDATVAEIAKESGVSPRTVFRYYESHDILIATTVRDMYEAFGRPIEDLAPPSEGLDDWIDHLALTIHTRNAEILGDAFWDIHAPRHDPSAALSEMDAFRRDNRIRGVRHLVNTAWETAGGTGDAPEDLTLAFALMFSAFATQALIVDFDQRPSEIASLAADLLTMLLRGAVDAQRSERDDTSPGADEPVP